MSLAPLRDNATLGFGFIRANVCAIRPAIDGQNGHTQPRSHRDYRREMTMPVSKITVPTTTTAAAMATFIHFTPISCSRR